MFVPGILVESLEAGRPQSVCFGQDLFPFRNGIEKRPFFTYTVRLGTEPFYVEGAPCNIIIRQLAAVQPLKADSYNSDRIIIPNPTDPSTATLINIKDFPNFKRPFRAHRLSVIEFGVFDTRPNILEDLRCTVTIGESHIVSLVSQASAKPFIDRYKIYDFTDWHDTSGVAVKRLFLLPLGQTWEFLKTIKLRVGKTQ